jgi:hypothetical protein
MSEKAATPGRTSSRLVASNLRAKLKLGIQKNDENKKRHPSGLDKMSEKAATSGRTSSRLVASNLRAKLKLGIQKNDENKKLPTNYLNFTSR